MPATELEVQCINKTDRYSAHERIHNIGGLIGAHRWKHSHDQAIGYIETGAFAYFVNRGGHKVKVIVAKTALGHKYLKTEADGEQPNNLLSLPECPP
jgi:hypothetical protein